MSDIMKENQSLNIDKKNFDMIFVLVQIKILIYYVNGLIII